MGVIGEMVLELHLSGVRSIDIAHRLNVAQSTVHYHLRQLREQPTVRKRERSGAASGARSTVRTREQVASLLDQGVPRASIARQLGITKSTVSYHARRLGATIDERFARRYDWNLVQAFYEDGHSVRDCCREFGFSSQTWCAAAKRGLVVARPGFRPLEEVFAAGTQRNRGHLKARLLRAGLKDGTCERCGIREWCGKPLTMALHHINGDRLDNRLENLELLCPNCHSQTDTFGGRNGRVRSGGVTWRPSSRA